MSSIRWQRHVVECHGDEGATVDTVAARCGMVPLGSHWRVAAEITRAIPFGVS